MSAKALTGRDPPAAATRAGQLAISGVSEQSRSTANQPVRSSFLTCTAGETTPHFYHLGLDIKVRQYGIGKRKMNLVLPTSTLKGMDRKEKAEVDGPSLPMAAPGAIATTLKLHPPPTTEGSPEPFTATFATGANSLKSEAPVKGYQLDDSSLALINPLLGRAIAVHLQRSGILRPRGTGNFDAGKLGAPVTELQNTEIIGMKVHAYLRAKVNGQTLIREIVEGKVGKVILQKTYDDLKQAEPNVFTGEAAKLSGSMPLIPGVYQIHVLFQDPNEHDKGGGAISIQEVHCDGDPLYP